MKTPLDYNFFLSEEERKIDFKKIFFRFIGNLHWIILSIAIALGLAYGVNHIITPVYKVTSQVLIQNENKNLPAGSNQTGNGTDNLMQGFGLFSGIENFDNQTLILSSYSLLYNTLQSLDFKVSYFKINRFFTTELYKNSPFRILYDSTHVQPIGVKFDIKILSDGMLKITARNKNAFLYNYQTNEKSDSTANINLSKIIVPGIPIKSDQYSFTVMLDSNYRPDLNAKYYFFFNSMDALVKSYKSQLGVKAPKKGATMVELSLLVRNVQKGTDFLNKLMEVYLNRSLNKKNELASQTINFIEQQLAEVSDSLMTAEKRKQDFQSSRKITDLTFQAQQISNEVSDIEKEKAALDAQQKYYIYLNNYIQGHSELESIIAPSSMGIDDKLLNELISQLNTLSQQKSMLMSSLRKKDHPMVRKLDAQIQNIKATLAENSRNILRNSQIALAQINKRLGHYEGQIQRLPETQRKFIGLERKFTLNNEIYTYLLQRRSEAQISKASNSPDNEIIDHAVLFGNDPIRPNIWFNYLIALLLGLIVPAVVINLQDVFNNKIITRDDVKNITEKPIIGHVLHIKEGIPETLMLEKPNSPLTEPFWAIRNRLNYFTAGVKKPVITVSSSFSGEGKTFCTINIATTYALSGTKTILVGFDLRNPKLYKAFNLNNEKGVSTCLLGMTTIEESIHKTAHPNLDIMLSGPIPDNPAQLISSLRTPALINKLKEKYDCIVIDSSPLGLVSETLYLSRLSDANILIARQSVTDREELKNCLMEAEVNEINNLSILINDVRIRKNFYRYGYSDKYGYGYKYQHNHIGQN